MMLLCTSAPCHCALERFIVGNLSVIDAASSLSILAFAQGVPTNDLHACGYVSIGCEPCTRPVLPNQHEREGRWWWEVRVLTMRQAPFLVSLRVICPITCQKAAPKVGQAACTEHRYALPATPASAVVSKKPEGANKIGSCEGCAVIRLRRNACLCTGCHRQGVRAALGQRGRQRIRAGGAGGPARPLGQRCQCAAAVPQPAGVHAGRLSLQEHRAGHVRALVPVLPGETLFTNPHTFPCLGSRLLQYAGWAEQESWQCP